MSRQLEVDYESAREFARHLDSAQTNLEAAAPTMPSRVLAGDGTAYIVAQISRFSEAAELFASLAGQTSGLVRKVLTSLSVLTRRLPTVFPSWLRKWNNDRG